MGLREYIRKRRFDVTPEPAPVEPKKSSFGQAGKLKKGHSKKLKFVVQKHQATQLHYDFRLELDGVLKSWAVPKGPSLNPHNKRLAMMVEDHPLGYGNFAGVIPEGNYGAGKVEIWDKGWYELYREAEDWPKTLQEGLKNGDLKFVLHGHKLKGAFVLVKTPHMAENAWLLIKKKDKYAKA